MGYQVKSVNNGPKALDLLESTHFDLVITDLKMKNVDGMDVLRKTRKLYPYTEVIMITGYATVDSSVQAMREGAYYYIAKPYKIDEVRKIVQEALLKVFDENPTLQKIKAGESVSEADLKALTSLVLTRNPNVDQAVLKEFFETADPLDHALRSIIGMDAEIVNERFSEFVARYSRLTANQVSFLNLLKNHISRYGSIELDQLYEPPFTTLHTDGLDGVFIDERMINDLISIIDTFKPQSHVEVTRT